MVDRQHTQLDVVVADVRRHLLIPVQHARRSHRCAPLGEGDLCASLQCGPKRKLKTLNWQELLAASCQHCVWSLASDKSLTTSRQTQITHLFETSSARLTERNIGKEDHCTAQAWLKGLRMSRRLYPHSRWCRVITMSSLLSLQPHLTFDVKSSCCFCSYLLREDSGGHVTFSCIGDWANVNPAFLCPVTWTLNC